MAIMELSIVVPCYNEQECIKELILRLNNVCKNFSFNYEIILVNDGSFDNTWKLMKKEASMDEKIVLINLSKNFGHQIALDAGLRVSIGKKIFIIDADLQDPPELLLKMLKIMKTDFDVVHGKRIKRKGETFFKRVSAFFFYRVISRLTNDNLPVDVGDFRLMSRRALNAYLSMNEKNRFNRGLISWAGFNQTSVEYIREARFEGKTKYDLKRMILLALDGITSFSIKPLRLSIYLAMICSLGTFFSIIYVLWEWFLGNTISGWTSIIILILFLNSIHFFLLGVLSEYIGRTFIEVKNRPLFFIKDIFTKAPSKKKKIITQINQKNSSWIFPH